MLTMLPCLDSTERAAARQRELNVNRDVAAALGHSALEAIESGSYCSESGAQVDWGPAVRAAREAKRSIPPDAALPTPEVATYPETQVQVANETTLGASRRLVEQGSRPLALNFANGIHPGGGFLSGARAQEEVLCRSSALFETLRGDAMYDAHRFRPRPDSTDWAIYSPDVPVFRRDDGTSLESPWPLSILTCAAPYARTIGQPESAELLRRRIRRVLAIAQAYQHPSLVLGAWGCGAFGNDPRQTAMDFRDALETDFSGAFAEVVFAVTDWSPERRFLGPFCEVFADPHEH